MSRAALCRVTRDVGVRHRVATQRWSSYRLEPLIALAKVVGFVVVPVTAKSRTSRSNSPVSSGSRDSVSS